MTTGLILAAVAVLSAAIVGLLVAEWRRPPEPTKRAVNRARLRRMHVVDRRVDDDGVLRPWYWMPEEERQRLVLERYERGEP